VDDERKVGGRSFQTRGPDTAKLRDPYVIVLVLGTIRSRLLRCICFVVFLEQTTSMQVPKSIILLVLLIVV